VIARSQPVEAPSTDPWRTRVTALPWGEALTLGLGFWFILAYVVVAVVRLRYPFEIEWMEGAVVDHVRRIMAGHALYVQPTLRFVPFVYPPVYFYLGALVSTPFGAGLFPLRLLSMAASLGCFALIFAFVRRESGHPRSAFLAVALFAACYPVSGGWYDLARIDSVFLCLLLGGSYLLRFHATTRGWGAAALLLVLAFFTKQSAIVVAAPLLCYAVWLAPRRGLLLAVGSLLVAAGAIWLLDRAHGGWYSYYVFRMPSRIQQTDAVAAPFLSHDLLPPVSIACALALAALLPEADVPRGRALFYTLLSSGLVGSAWLSRLHAGAYENVLIPAHAAIAVLFGLFLARSRGSVGEHVLRRGAGLPVHVCVLVLVQFGMLLADPRRQLPSAHDVEMGRQLVARMTSVPGEVWLPQHGYLGSLAGKRTYAHAMAVYDVIRAGDPGDRDSLVNAVRQALAARQFDLVIIDRAGWMRPDLEHSYEAAGPVFPSPAGFWTLSGMRLRPQTVYRPRRTDALRGP
jgi:4-amino-4-deoxy-L-arabinose transferase-like glycosyltransferase